MKGERPRDTSSESHEFQPFLLAEGKTKIIWSTQNPLLVRIESKDAITAGDGLRRDVMDGKAALATQTTVNVLKLLEAKGIQTHFVAQDSDTSFIAKKAQMIPIECVARRIATGSFLKRQTHVTEGHRFAEPPVEFYFKDDSNHDPLIGFDQKTGRLSLYDAKAPIATTTPLQEISPDAIGVSVDELLEMQTMTRKVFEIVENVWADQDISLVDMKIEFGKDEGGKLMVADVIDNDSWRIWPGGDKSRMLDKQRYRDGEDIASIREDYQRVADMTSQFRLV